MKPGQLSPAITAHLKVAMDHLRQAIAGLDQSSTECVRCGAGRWHNRDEYQAAQELNGALTRIEKALGIRGKKPKKERGK